MTAMPSTHLPLNESSRIKRRPALQNGSLWSWVVVILIVNLPLAWGEIRTELLYLPDSVSQGQWWRLFTFPLVHLSWYHLLLDAGGFLLLYGSLEEKRWIPKALIIIGASAGSLALTSILNPSIARQGLSGLSGIAHGLMAVAAFEMLWHQRQRTWGWISLMAVVGKSAYELWSGQVLFEFMHMGMCGQPLAACHAGGVVGALAAYAVILSVPGKGVSRQDPLPNKSFRYGRQGKVFQHIMRVTAQVVTRIMYRVTYSGVQHIPDKGAAVLVCNHVSYVDWLIIAGACRRPIHFVMHASIYRLPFLHWIFRLAKVIPIESGKRNPAALRQAFEAISTVLKKGGIVCLFPEGHLTRTGHINAFRPGIERIIRDNPVPVIPLALRGMWGSFFSHKNGPAMRCRPHHIWAPVELVVGRLVYPINATASHLRCTVQTLRGRNA